MLKKPLMDHNRPLDLFIHRHHTVTPTHKNPTRTRAHQGIVWTSTIPRGHPNNMGYSTLDNPLTALYHDERCPGQQNLTTLIFIRSQRHNCSRALYINVINKL